MKRIIEFNYLEEKYYLSENGNTVFSIDASDLKFNSIEFYNGVYKDKNTDIELVNKIDSTTNKKSNYIFSWLSEIISSIREEFIEETTDVDESAPVKIIPLYEFAACAGDGFFIDDNIPHSDIADTTGEADYAVTISGDSMEPTIKDKSVVFVKKDDKPENDNVGLFVVDGNVMCKRYKKHGRGYKLVPDNEKYKTIVGKEIETIIYLGKVLL